MKRNHARRRAFTLIELMVTIGIIILLVGLTVTAGVAVMRRGEVRKTETALALLDMALTEWQTQADRPLLVGPVSGGTYPPDKNDMFFQTPHVFSATEVLRVLGRNRAARDIIAQIKPDLLFRYDTTQAAPRWIALLDPDDPDANAGQAPNVYSGNALPAAGTARPLDDLLAPLDAWGRPIRAVHPGPAWDGAGAPPDADGTYNLNAAQVPAYPVEQVYGRCAGRRVLFVSAGPDGKFGDRSPGASPAAREQAEDNLYSYEPAEE